MCCSAAVTCLQFVPGPGDHAITILQMKSLAWVLEHNVMSSDPVVADKLPLPAGLAVTLQTARAGPLVQTVDSCEHLQVRLLLLHLHSSPIVSVAACPSVVPLP